VFVETNTAARVVSGTWKFDCGLLVVGHSKLHWLDVPQWISHKLDLMTYRCPGPWFVILCQHIGLLTKTFNTNNNNVSTEKLRSIWRTIVRSRLTTVLTVCQSSPACTALPAEQTQSTGFCCRRPICMELSTS